MAVVRNITPDALSVFRSDAPPCKGGDEVFVKDENFVGRAWPHATWELVTPPEGDYADYADDDTDDAYVFVLPEPEEKALADMTKSELLDVAAEKGIDVTGLTTKADLLAALTPQEG